MVEVAAGLGVVALAAVLLSSTLGGGVQATLGFGGSFIAVPVLAVLLPDALPAAMLIGLLPVTAIVAWRERGSIDVAAFRRIAVARLPGIAVGAALVAVAPTSAITVLVSVCLVLAVVAAAAGWEVPTTPSSQRVVGAISGFTGTAAALGGPPLALLYRRAGGADRRGTMSAVFTIGIVVALALLAVGGELGGSHLGIGAVVAVGTVVGSSLAVPVVRRASDELLRRAVLAWAAVGAVAAGLRAVG